MQSPNSALSPADNARRFDLRTRLLLILILALIPAATFLAYDVNAIEARARAEAAGELLRLSKSAAASYSQHITEAEHLLAAIARFPEVRGSDMAACAARLAELDALYGEAYPGFGVADRNGDQICSSLPDAQTVNVADRLWFREVLRTGAFAIGEFAIGRRTGIPILGLGYPLRDAAGEVAGVLSTALPLAWMQEQAEELDLPPDTVLTILDQDGVILARAPDGEQYIGQRLNYVEMQQVRSQGSNVIEGTGADGVERTYAIAPIRGPGGTDVWLSVGRAPTAIYAGVRQQIARDVMGIAAIIVVALAGVWFGTHRWIMQPVRRLVAASRQLATGDLTTRTGQYDDGSEFGELSAALDQMAETLQERDRQLTLALGAARMVAWTWDTQCNRVETTENFVEIFGLSLDEYLARGAEVIHQEDRARQQQTVAQALAEGKPFHNEVRIFRPEDGQMMWVDEYGTPVLDEAGQVQRVAGVTVDITARKLASAQVRYQAKILESIHDAALAMDPDLNITYWNRGAEMLYGWTADEVMGRPVLEFLGTMLTPEVLEAAQSELRASGRMAVQIASFRRDGTPFFVDSITTAIYDGGGRVNGFVTINRDITARRELEEQLRRHAEEIEALLELLPVAVLTAHDARAERITGNEAAYALLRAPVGANLSRSAPPEEYLADRRRLIDGREPEPYELPMQQAAMQGMEVRDSEIDYMYEDGTVLHLFGHARPLFDENGQVRGAVGVFMDITERKRAEEALRESEARFRTLADDAPVLIWINGMEGCEFVNHAYLELTGRTLEELQGIHWAEALHPVDRAEYLSAYRYAMAIQARFEAQTRMRRFDGEYRWIHSVGVPRFGPSGELIGYVGSSTDITEIKQAEQLLQEINFTLEQRVHERTAELERSNRELDQFAYVASHDLKAPLRGIDTLSGFLLEDTAGLLPEDSQRHLAQIRSRIHRMEALLNDLLTYSRAGRRRYAPERFGLAELVHEVVELSAVPEGFVVEVVEPMPTMVGERVPLEIVMRNLIGNAVKHHDQPQTGRVVIAATELGVAEPGREERAVQAEGAQTGGPPDAGVVEAGVTALHEAAPGESVWIEVSVTDNGPGIDAAFHERIFEPFQTLRPRDEVEGSGIGLTVVKKLVETRGGKVWLESARGEGAVFRFTWPRGF